MRDDVPMSDPQSVPGPFDFANYDRMLEWAIDHLHSGDEFLAHIAAVIIVHDDEFEESDPMPAQAASRLAADGHSLTSMYAKRAHDAGTSWAIIGDKLWRPTPAGSRLGVSPQAVQQRCERFIGR
jgi:hypothetical protein